MTPTMIETIPRERGDAEVWSIGRGHALLVLPEGDTSYISVHSGKSRAEVERLTSEIEAIAKQRGLWLETAPSIDISMVVIRTVDVATFLEACAASFEQGQSE